MTRLFVAGYPREATKDDIAALFRQFGATGDDVTFPRDRRTRRKKGYAYVNVRDEQAARAAAAAFDGFLVDDKPLNVTLADERPARRGRR